MLPILFPTIAGQVIPWKWLIVGVAVLTLIGAGAFGVYSYNQAITRADKAEAGLRAKDAELQRLKDDYQTLQRQQKEIEEFNRARDERQRKGLDVRRRNMAQRSVRDEEGNIIPGDDPVLALLNGLFPPGAGGKGRADPADSAGVSR